CKLSALFALCICVVLLRFCLLGRSPSWEQQQQQQQQRLVCYYTTAERDAVSLLDVPGELCTHINIGPAELRNTTLSLSPRLQYVLQNETRAFRAAHPQVQLLLWIGGADSGREFATMVKNHARRKQFLRSLKAVLHAYPSLDGIDLDWEFPSAYDKERMHFAQLLHEIRLEWARERQVQRLLSLAVAAPEGIAYFAYNIREINLYVDHVNLMAYDFHFYREDMPFTGLNAPLYARPGEHSIMGTFNVNYTAHWWLSNGLEPQRLVVGLPTYGHSFTLVNVLNSRIGAPASGPGKCGALGFTTLAETCECAQRFLSPLYRYDNATCSPYLTAMGEWISYESKTSIECKVNYVKSLGVGGVMLFSLNSDDVRNSCGYLPHAALPAGKPVFPLAQAARAILRASA
ncbi:hypothetical protein KR222_001490, partial [Zaprionus bogoriensis]